jgi:hypothetical protein
MIEILRRTNQYNSETYPYEISDPDIDQFQPLTREDFLSIYRQMTKIMVDETVENYDPDKPRAGWGSSESHKHNKD